MRDPQNSWFMLVDNGKSEHNMDDDWRYPHFRKPPYKQYGYSIEIWRNIHIVLNNIYIYCKWSTCRLQWSSTNLYVSVDMLSLSLCIYIYTYWLVVWNMFYYSIRLGIRISTDELIFFRGVGWNHQPVYIYYIYMIIYVCNYTYYVWMRYFIWVRSRCPHAM